MSTFKYYSRVHNKNGFRYLNAENFKGKMYKLNFQRQAIKIIALSFISELMEINSR